MSPFSVKKTVGSRSTAPWADAVPPRRVSEDLLGLFGFVESRGGLSEDHGGPLGFLEEFHDVFLVLFFLFGFFRLHLEVSVELLLGFLPTLRALCHGFIFVLVLQFKLEELLV